MSASLPVLAGQYAASEAKLEVSRKSAKKLLSSQRSLMAKEIILRDEDGEFILYKPQEEGFNDRLLGKAIIQNSILADALGSTRATRKELDRKALYQMGDCNAEDLRYLSGDQRAVAELKRDFSVREIAEQLGKSPSTVQELWEAAVKTLRKIGEKKALGVPPGLTRQQEKIFILRVTEKRTIIEISRILHLSAGKVNEQIEIITSKLP